MNSDTPRTDALDNEIKTNPPSDAPTPYRASEYESVVRLARDLEQELTTANAAIEAMIEDGCNKIMAMSDEQVTALTRLEGSNPDDVARLGGQAIELAILKTQLAAKEAELQALKQNAGYYQALRSANWHDGKGTLVVTRAYAVKLGMMTYSGDLLDEAIRSKP